MTVLTSPGRPVRCCLLGVLEPPSDTVRTGEAGREEREEEREEERTSRMVVVVPPLGGSSRVTEPRTRPGDGVSGHPEEGGLVTM